MLTTRYNWTIRFSLLTPVFLLLALLSMGGGHGWYEPALILFPFGMVGTFWQDTIAVPFIIIGLFQYPLYGFFIDKASNRPYKGTLIFAIVIMHFALAGLILIKSSEHWNSKML